MLPLYSINNPHVPWLKESLISEDGVLNCSKIIDRYNSDPFIIENNYTISDDAQLPPDGLKIKFSVDNRSGNFDGEFPIKV